MSNVIGWQHCIEGEGILNTLFKTPTIYVLMIFKFVNLKMVYVTNT